MTSQNLTQKLLTYVGYCLPLAKFKFSYLDIQKTLLGVYGQEYQISTLRKEFSNLKKAGLLETKTRYRQTVPILSSEGKLALKTKLTFKRFDNWDGRWRVVLFDIPEHSRAERLTLKTKLAELGFGQLQKSAYLSPFPLLGVLSRFAANLGARQYLSLMEVSKMEDENKIVETAWDLKKINEGYKKFIKNNNQLTTHNQQLCWPLYAKQLEEEFAHIYAGDPHLPKELLPSKWAGDEAYQIFKTISNSY